MKIVAISDTHGSHNELNLPKGDLLIHAGDVSKRGTKEEIIAFLDWFQLQDFKYKIFIAGNHDFFFEKESFETIQAIIPPTVIYLNDSGITLEGIHIWGSPITPWFFDWAFNRHRGKAINKHWQLIPENTDILITHGPPYGMLDTTLKGQQVGCERLAERIDFLQPKMSIFGHIHEARGIFKNKYTHFVNAAVVNLQYQVVHAPYVFNSKDIISTLSN